MSRQNLIVSAIAVVVLVLAGVYFFQAGDGAEQTEAPGTAATTESGADATEGAVETDEGSTY